MYIGFSHPEPHFPSLGHLALGVTATGRPGSPSDFPPNGYPFYHLPGFPWSQEPHGELSAPTSTNATLVTWSPPSILLVAIDFTKLVSALWYSFLFSQLFFSWNGTFALSSSPLSNAAAPASLCRWELSDTGTTWEGQERLGGWWPDWVGLGHFSYPSSAPHYSNSTPLLKQLRFLCGPVSHPTVIQ